MENKFTKGKWFVNTNMPNFDGVRISRFEPSTYWKNGNVDRVGDYPIATIHDGFPDWDNKYPVIDNAKLIAAAPDMFAALEYLIESINPIDACRGKFESLGNDRAYVGGMTLPTDESILRCIEAIKKATE